jgi:hypothetical protein
MTAVDHERRWRLLADSVGLALLVVLETRTPARPGPGAHS